MTNDTVDKDILRKRFAKAVITYDRQAAVQKDIARRMCEMLKLSASGDTFSKVFEAGCGTGIFTEMIDSIFHPDMLYINDICPEMGDEAGKKAKNAVFICGDAETIDFPEGLTLITSCSAIQWFTDFDAFLSKCNEALADGGMLAFSTFGEDNLKEIKQFTGAGLNYMRLNDLEESLHDNGFNISVSKQEKTKIWFPSPVEVLRHLKETGVTATGRNKGKNTWTKGTLETFADEYRKTYGQKDGSVPVTYHPIYIISTKDTTH